MTSSENDKSKPPHTPRDFEAIDRFSEELLAPGGDEAAWEETLLPSTPEQAPEPGAATPTETREAPPQASTAPQKAEPPESETPEVTAITPDMTNQEASDQDQAIFNDLSAVDRRPIMELRRTAPPTEISEEEDAGKPQETVDIPETTFPKFIPAALQAQPSTHRPAATPLTPPAESNAEAMPAVSPPLATDDAAQEGPSASTAEHVRVHHPIHRLPPWLTGLIRKKRYGTMALLLGVLLLIAALGFGYYQQGFTPFGNNTTPLQGDTPESTLDQARASLEAGEYETARTLLEPVLAESGTEQHPTEAALLELEVLLRGHEAGNTPEAWPKAPAIQAQLDAFVEANPEHPRLPTLLQWKARLYELADMPLAALDVYQKLTEEHPEAPALEATLLHAADIALEQQDALRAAHFARTLLQRYPQASQAAEARLMLGDAYALTGSIEDARTLYIRTAQSETDTAVEAAAYQRLGRLSLGQGQYPEAIQYLERRMALADYPNNLDAAHLHLAEALRRSDRTEEARETLLYLVNYFPESRHLPAAYDALITLLEDNGEMRGALYIAQLAVARYPDDPALRQAQGRLLGWLGRPLEAAQAYLVAEAADAQEPDCLWAAAQYYEAAGRDDQARRLYQTLQTQYPLAQATRRARLEIARHHFEQGQTGKAVQSLEELAAALTASPERVEVQYALAQMYHHLGLDARAADHAQDVAATTDSPELRADATCLLFQSNAVGAGLNWLPQLDSRYLSAQEQVALRVMPGASLLDHAPQAAHDWLAEAHRQYPEIHSPEGTLWLLLAKLALDEDAAAEALLSEIQAQGPMEGASPAIQVQAAGAWGDYLSRQGDYLRAVPAYAYALELLAEHPETVSAEIPERIAPIKPAPVNPEWLRFQYAVALLHTGQSSRSLPLFEALAESDAPWAEEAALYASIARFQPQAAR